MRQVACCQKFDVFFCFQIAPRTVRRLHLTSERLGAAAASTAVYAGYKRSFSHCLFCGVTAAVAPNRQLAAAELVAHLSFFLQRLDFISFLFITLPNVTYCISYANLIRKITTITTEICIHILDRVI